MTTKLNKCMDKNQQSSKKFVNEIYIFIDKSFKGQKLCNLNLRKNSMKTETSKRNKILCMWN